ncbi:MAG TPA: UDP-glucose/GDP-mannose dehydrogenase family protein [Terriglobia bacterium]|nr:UDP-glucose/GDP-mannose dehydrogenase family protein [Terriglobia bacterium]
MKVTVIGTGYVGLVTGACLSYLGHKVICVDTDAEKIAALQSGELPFYEPHLPELMKLVRTQGGIDFACEAGPAVAGSDVVFIAVGTPSLPSGEADLTALKSAARSIGAGFGSSLDPRFRVVVTKSTVPVGSANLVEAVVREVILESAADPGSIHFGVVSNPEFLREGSAVADSLYPERIVLGSADARALEVLERLYEPLRRQAFAPPAFLRRPRRRAEVPLVKTSLTSAELIKYASNAFLAMKISFANEMANISDRVGADVLEVMRGISLDSRIGTLFLNAGIGWGGSCFRKDIQSLLYTANEYGYSAPLLDATLRVNHLQRTWVIRKLQEKLFVLKGRTIALLRLAFKPGTDDLRDAPSLEIASWLLAAGANVKVYDPVAMAACAQQHPHLDLVYAHSAADAAKDAHAAVLVTEWDQFRQLDLPAMARAMARPLLVDGRNLFDAVVARRAGFDYIALGRSAGVSQPVYMMQPAVAG